jgi:hypothetical protein
MHLTASGTH